MFNMERQKVSGIVNNDGKRKHAAQRRGYKFLRSCLPDSFVLGSAASRSAMM